MVVHSEDNEEKTVVGTPVVVHAAAAVDASTPTSVARLQCEKDYLLKTHEQHILESMNLDVQLSECKDELAEARTREACAKEVLGLGLGSTPKCMLTANYLRLGVGNAKGEMCSAMG